MLQANLNYCSGMLLYKLTIPGEVLYIDWWFFSDKIFCADLGTGVLIRWNGLVEWNSGMEYWNGGMLQRAYLIKIIIQLWCLDSVDLWNGNILESKI